MAKTTLTEKINKKANAGIPFGFISGSIISLNLTFQDDPEFSDREFTNWVAPENCWLFLQVSPENNDQNTKNITYINVQTPIGFFFEADGLVTWKSMIVPMRKGWAAKIIVNRRNLSSIKYMPLNT